MERSHFLLIIVIFTVILLTGCTSTSNTSTNTVTPANTLSQRDQAAKIKMDAMLIYDLSISNTIVNSYESGDDASARSNATILMGYIDQNLPEMQQLADNADIEQPAAREFVLSLVDLRNSMAYLVKSIDYENAGDYTDAATALSNATALQRSERSHLENMFPRTPTTPVPATIPPVE